MGDVKNVADGYGRNFLLPRKLGKLATEHAMKEVEALKKKADQMEKIRAEKAQELGNNLKGVTVEIVRKASDKGTLFEGIERQDIAKALKEKTGFNIEEEMVNLPEAIKHIGSHSIDLKLTPEAAAQITLEVKAE